MHIPLGGVEAAVKQVDEDGLFVLPAGRIPPDPSELPEEWPAPRVVTWERAGDLDAKVRDLEPVHGDLRARRRERRDLEGERIGRTTAQLPAGCSRQQPRSAAFRSG